jgi:hypothetical protein
MTAIVILSVTGKLSFSHGGDSMLAAFEKNMNVVVHEDPGIDKTFSISNVLTEAFKKLRLVLVVFEYLGFVDSPYHNVVKGSRYIQSCLAWHGLLAMNNY